MRFPPAWKHWAQQRFQNMANEVMSTMPLLLSHQIDRQSARSRFVVKLVVPLPKILAPPSDTP
jgi:hypothetical protein